MQIHDVTVIPCVTFRMHVVALRIGLDEIFDLLQMVLARLLDFDVVLGSAGLR